MRYDIIIIGAGMVGATLACALPSSMRVAIIDSTPEAAPEDPRLIALTHGSCCLLQNLGLWPTLSPHAEAIKQIHVSHQGKFGITRIHASELKLKTLGHLIPAKYINHALAEKLQKCSNVTEIRPATLKSISTLEDEFTTITVEIKKEIKSLEARYIIGADGTHSTVRELLNIPTKIIDYQQSAIVTTTDLQRSHKNIAYERFQSQGAIAMLPLTGQRCATIWTDSTANINSLMQLSDEEFLAKLQKEFGYRLGRFQKIHKRHTYPLQLRLTEEFIKHHVILIGNAAHTVHPIAAQGFNLALLEAAKLVESLPTGKITHLKNDWNIKLSHHLTWLFSSDFFIFNLSRQLGMLGLDICEPAKRFFIGKTMGITGNIPYLLREKDYYEQDINSDQ